MSLNRKSVNPSSRSRAHQGRTKNQASCVEARSKLWRKALPLDWSLWPAEARLLLSLTAIWSLGGLLILASASWWVASREMGEGAYYLKRQLIWMTASWGLLAMAISTDLRRWMKVAGPGVWLGCVLVAATLVFGSTVNGASRWLVIGPLQIQPSELVKPFVVLQAASRFASGNAVPPIRNCSGLAASLR